MHLKIRSMKLIPQRIETQKQKITIILRKHFQKPRFLVIYSLLKKIAKTKQSKQNWKNEQKRLSQIFKVLLNEKSET